MFEFGQLEFHLGDGGREERGGSRHSGERKRSKMCAELASLPGQCEGMD